MSKKFWADSNEERLLHLEPHDAIEAIIDGLHPVGFDEIGEVTVYEYAPMKPSANECGSPLESILERLDEKYADPDGYDGFDPTEAMREAERDFIAAVLAEYVPWMCCQTGEKVTVNALEWVREHRPDWLTETRENP